ncbi:MAG: UDP-2,3-diacylglucosamine diphosphatase [Xanthomonadaceae bacterium]|jgi:UDP-2,3-diacylglucosamine hydrolase|nr:UDP-2,3-diacylglucosamine diphosphatase [Xanthomonadaceae bacterium]
MTTLFISDLHLDSSRPETTASFERFLRDEAAKADALYILGDLFEAWLGDDDPSAEGARVATALRAISDAGVLVHFIRGNRDFLLGEDYARRAGMRILPDPTVIDLYGKPALILHGDLLCTDDAAYQQFRAQSRNPAWQAQMLAQPLPVRQAIAQQARAASFARQSEMQQKDRTQYETITDVAPATVDEFFTRYGIDTMIHGHTHRPAIHELEADGKRRRRIVLGDWYDQGSILRVVADGMELEHPR